MSTNYITSIICEYDKKEKFLIGTFISFITVLIIAAATNYFIGNEVLVNYELWFLFAAILTFAYYLYSKNFIVAIYLLTFLFTLISYILLTEVEYRLALFHVIVPLYYFFLFRLKAALILTTIHIIIVSGIYVYGYFTYKGLPEILYPGNILSLVIATLVIIFFGLIYHLTLEKYYQELERANLQNEMLLNEIHHRIKNNLQMISNMLGLQKQSTKDKFLKEILEKNRFRIHSIATVHDILYRYKSFTEISFYNYMNKLTQTILEVHDKKTKINIIDTKIVLAAEDVVKLGIITNELVINSIKHAKIDNNLEIEISLKKEENSLVYTYQDNGTNEIDINAHDTLGYRIISMLIEQLEAKLTLETKKGLLFKMEVPLRSLKEYPHSIQYKSL